MPSFILNFHGIGSAVRPYEPGEQPYWLGRQELARVLDLVQVMSDSTEIALTVDDGNGSDYDVMVPELRKRGLVATFFVLAGKLDQVGYLRRSELRDMAMQGFGIGSHGLDHVDWVTCNDISLEREVRLSKEIIEAATGRPITAAAAPFGSYDRRVLVALARSGYRRVFSSDGGPRLTTGWPTPRQTLRAGVDIVALRRQIARQPMHHRARSELRILAKSWLPRSAVQPFSKATR